MLLSKHVMVSCCVCKSMPHQQVATSAQILGLLRCVLGHVMHMQSTAHAHVSCHSFALFVLRSGKLAPYQYKLLSTIIPSTDAWEQAQVS